MADIVKTGPSSWRVRVRTKGQPEVCRTFKSEDAALKYKAKVEKAIRDGKPVETGVTVRACVQAFRKLREPKRPIAPGSTEHYYLAHIEAGLGSVLVDRLTPQRIAEWVADRAEDGAGPSTMSSEVGKLGTVLKHASLWLHAVLPDVVGAARPLLKYQGLIGPSNKRERRPSEAELGLLYERLDAQMCDIVRFAIATAMRRGEITRILRSDLNRAERLILVRDRKHPTKKLGNHKWVPLVADTGIDAWEILHRQPHTEARFFPRDNDNISKRFLEACNDAGIENLHFHDLRHEGTSRLFEADWPIERVALVTGHEKWEDLQRYTHLRPSSLTDGTRPGTPPRPGNPPTDPHLQDTSEP